MSQVQILSFRPKAAELVSVACFLFCEQSRRLLWARSASADKGFPETNEVSFGGSRDCVGVSERDLAVAVKILRATREQNFGHRKQAAKPRMSLLQILSFRPKAAELKSAAFIFRSQKTHGQYLKKQKNGGIMLFALKNRFILLRRGR